MKNRIPKTRNWWGIPAEVEANGEESAWVLVGVRQVIGRMLWLRPMVVAAFVAAAVIAVAAATVFNAWAVVGMLALAAVVAGLFVVTAYMTPSGLVEWPQTQPRSRARRAARLLELQWAATASGVAYSTLGRGIDAPSMHPAVVPPLKVSGYINTSTGWKVNLLTPSGVIVSEWISAAARLASGLDAHSVEIVPDPRRPESRATVEVHEVDPFTFHAEQRSASSHADASGETTWKESDSDDSYDPFSIVDNQPFDDLDGIIFDSSGESIGVPIPATHCLVAGQSGSGKSTLLHAIIATLASRDVRLFGIDLKRVELVAKRSRFERLALDHDEAAAAIEDVASILEEREREFERLGFRSAQDLRGDDLDRFPPVVLVVDEMQEINQYLGGETDKERRAWVSRVQRRLATVLAKGRAVGVSVVVATQFPTTDVLSSLGRSNLQTIIGLRVRGTTEARVIFGADAPPLHELDRPGRGWIEMPNGERREFQASKPVASRRKVG